MEGEVTSKAFKDNKERDGTYYSAMKYINILTIYYWDMLHSLCLWPQNNFYYFPFIMCTAFVDTKPIKEWKLNIKVIISFLYHNDIKGGDTKSHCLDASSSENGMDMKVSPWSWSMVNWIPDECSSLFNM